jgi:hypothetical protein
VVFKTIETIVKFLFAQLIAIGFFEGSVVKSHQVILLKEFKYHFCESMFEKEMLYLFNQLSLEYPMYLLIFHFGLRLFEEEIISCKYSQDLLLPLLISFDQDLSL